MGCACVCQRHESSSTCDPRRPNSPESRLMPAQRFRARRSPGLSGQIGNHSLSNSACEEFVASPLGACQPMSRAGAPRLASWQECKAKKLMFDHLAGPIDVGEVARSCRVSRGYFISAFGASTGLTPHQWLICSRLHRAQKLLLSTDLSLAEIAQDCGFYDQSHFNRTFSQRTGVPPGKWRRARRAA